MKQCPVCKTSYGDDSLSFCLNDGAALTAAPFDSEATQQMSFGAAPTFQARPPVRVDLQPGPTEPASVPTITAETKRRGVSPLLILAIVGLLAILGISGIAGAYFVFVRKDNSMAGTTVSTPTPTATPAPLQNVTPAGGETQALKDELEKLKREVSEQKNKKTETRTETPVSSPIQQSTGTPTARVNSPGDGFLSLRTEPSVKTGTQLVKMPTGSIVQLEDCQREFTTVDTKRGRWCMVSYNGQTGWAFDAWLVY
jgi:hypothetical protein